MYVWFFDLIQYIILKISIVSGYSLLNRTFAVLLKNKSFKTLISWDMCLPSCFKDINKAGKIGLAANVWTDRCSSVPGSYSNVLSCVRPYPCASASNLYRLFVHCFIFSDIVCVWRQGLCFCTMKFYLGFQNE